MKKLIVFFSFALILSACSFQETDLKEIENNLEHKSPSNDEDGEKNPPPTGRG